jgi:MurNAc alpha-1-phosphate uridylyltransferase
MLPLAVLAGGFATRLGDLSRNSPKSLIEINGRPFIDWQLDLLMNSGYTDFVFCVSYKSDAIQKYLGDGSDRGVNIQFSLDGETQLGTGGAIQKAIPLLGNEFGVIYGDSYLPIDYSAVEQDFLSSNSQGVMAVFKNENRLDRSNVAFIDGNLIDYQKGARNHYMHYIDSGLTYFKKNAFIPWADQSVFDLSVLCNKLSAARQLRGFEVFDRFYEIGSIDGIEDFSSYLKGARDEL